MAKSSKPLFNNDGKTFSYNWDNVNNKYYPAQKPEDCVLVKNDYPPSEQSVASILIDLTYSNDANQVFVECALYFGNNVWGTWHSIEDDDGQTSKIVTTTKVYFEANLYSQSWWKENFGFAIRLRTNFTGTGNITGNGVGVVR